MRPSSGASPYDAIPYPGGPHAQAHPDRLAAHAALFGVEAAPPAGCRVLEIGCGDGGHLLALAVALPDATLVGIDSSAHAIARARDVAHRAGIANARFEEVAIEDCDVPAAGFDYVIAHGVYSWVPAPVREQLLALCAHALAERGVAFVSYNALPGARVRHTLRELLLLALDGVEEPAERIAGARRVLRLLGGPHRETTLLGAEAATLLDCTDAALFHDVLAAVNEPVLFSEFAARAADHDLQYLAEANFLEMQAGIVPEELRNELLGGEVLRQEQVLDYLKVRRFRQTLLCRASLALDRTLPLERLARLAISTVAEEELAEDPQPPGSVTFVEPGGARMTTEHQVVVRAMRQARLCWPDAVWIADLVDSGRSPAERDTLCAALLHCYAGNLVTLHADRPALVTRAGERPRASALARLQAGEGHVPNLRLVDVRLEDEFGRRLLALLDGTRDRAALRADLEGVAGLSGDKLARALDLSLERLAHSALLVA